MSHSVHPNPTVLSAQEIRPEDLPAWMRTPHRGVDWGLLLVILFGVLITLPFAARPGLPRYTDHSLYQYRSEQIASLIKEGMLFSRWMPDQYYGYGSPLLNYLPPLPHYLPGLHQVLTDVSPTDSLRLFIILTMLASGVGMYLFARQRWGEAGGVVGALSYQFSTPLALSLPFLWGDFAALLGLAALPFAAWTLDRLRLMPTRSRFLAAVFALSFLFLTETRVAALGSIALFVVVFTGRWLNRDWRASLFTAAALISAVGITAFFWLPALLETNLIYWVRLTDPPYAGTIPLMETFGLPFIPDPRLILPSMSRGIGSGAALLALIAACGFPFIRRARLKSGDDLLLGALGLILALLASPLMEFFWAHPSGFQSIHPYHLLLIAVFCLSAAGAGAARWLELLPSQAQSLGLAGLCLIPLIAAVPVFSPPSLVAGEDSNPDQSARAELRGEHLGTLHEGLLLPVDVPFLPDPVPENSDGENTRVNQSTLTLDSRIGTLPRGALSFNYIVNMQQPAEVEFYTLYYPGWTAVVANQETAIQPSPQGLISIRLPAVNGALTLHFSGTPPRDWAWFLTIGALVVVVVVANRLPAERNIPEPEKKSPHLFWGAAAILCLFALISLWIRIDPSVLPYRPEPLAPLPRFFNGGIDLLGYRLESAFSKPGRMLEITVYWGASRPVQESMQSELWLLQPGDLAPRVRSVHRFAGGVSSLEWSMGKRVRDRFMLYLPSDLAPGDYMLRVAVGECTSRSLLPCERIAGLDSFSALGQREPDAVTIPVVIRIQP